MPNLPEEVSQAWNQREGPVVLTTVDAAGEPNAIYASSVSKYAEDKLLIADNYFDKTRRNILNGSRGALVFITKDKKAYQIKGRLERLTSGPMFDDMKKWNPSRLPGHAVAVLYVEAVYQGAKKMV